MKFGKLMRNLGLIILIVIINIFGGSNSYIMQAKAVSFAEINHPDVFLKQVNGDKQCTLVAATMLIRRAAMLSGNTNWSDITVEKVKKEAWVDGVGLKYTFTYEGYTVNKASFGKEPVNEVLALLKDHPEGIVLYDQYRVPRSHAVLLTDYTDEMFYCADPSDAVPYGRIPITQGLVQVNDAEFYYYVSSPSIPSPTPSAIEEYENPLVGEGSINPLVTEGTENPLVGEGNIEPLVTEGSIPTSTTEGNEIFLQDEDGKTTSDINTYALELSQAEFIYDGNDKKPVVTIAGLVENIDYSVFYINNVYPGSASVIITGIGTYSGFIIKNFEIREATIYDYFNEINVSVAKNSIKVGKTTKVQTSIPEFFSVVSEFSSDEQSSLHEVKVSYSSTNSNIAKVNTKGKITGKKKGTSKINVTVELVDGTKKVFTLNIKVKE